MALSREAIEEFKEAYRKELGKDISDQEAQEQGESLLELIDLLLKMKNKEK